MFLKCTTFVLRKCIIFMKKRKGKLFEVFWKNNVCALLETFVVVYVIQTFWRLNEFPSQVWNVMKQSTGMFNL